MLAKDPSKRIESASKLLAILKRLGYDAHERQSGGPETKKTVQPDFKYSLYLSAEANHTLSFDTKDTEIQSFVASLKARRRNKGLLRLVAIFLAVVFVIVVLVKFVF